MKYLETEKKKIICNHISYFCDSICSVLLRINFFRSPPENGIAFGTTEFGSGNVQPTEPIQSAPATAAKQTAASNQDIL
jgi:hypothetical protein